MLLLTSILNTMYTSLNLRIVLVGTEIWTDVDQITVTHLLDHAFHFFAPWARRFLKPRIYFDHAQLLLGRHYRGTLGLATQGTVCNTDASTSIIRFSNNENVYNAAGSAHELGHALIFGHDDEAGNVARFCRCPGCKERCIMRSKLSECTEFSNCSAADFYDRLMMGKLNCLLNMPPVATLTYNQCGNGLLEEDEECDCGRDKVCRDNGCCQSNCTLAPGVTCVSGHCCTKCQFDLAGKLCRDIGDECDLPEYCSGASHLCPEDVFRQDGSACGKSDICFQGKCNNHDRQCKAIFGEGKIS
ncbi:disintegrin and metalloproteinase domain-containing protein 9-like [Alligator mississippiensis]|uniref:disintegrin and metalloproteinase domain-containing protein 9-like n=1 Tax=Alligator mississippiensis TaxID=8496 RepID=UPI002877CCD5|nr:disintegrin and metalloproteinase domain-containing protein 9-like [Alligator mississippiensis]XP_059582911.1 disintegrin and metalloproteinase domain-containing protein 9-like [Alligator mississippiensis]